MEHTHGLLRFTVELLCVKYTDFVPKEISKHMAI